MLGGAGWPCSATVLKENPNLTGRAGGQGRPARLRAEMTELSRSRESVQAKRAQAEADRRALGLDATGLEDAGSDGIDADA